MQQTESPFIAEVLRYPLPAKFRMPQVETFDRVKDPVDHFNTYKNQTELHGYQDPVRCRAFATTLKGPALAWFNRLPPSSITSFRELSIAFVSHFIGARTYKKPSYHLLTVKQGSKESLKSYVQRFNAESLKIDIPDEKFAIIAFITGLGVQSKDLMFSISKNPQASMAEVLAKVEKYINGEEALISKKESSSTHKQKKRDRQAKRTKPQKTKRSGKVPKERQRAIPKKAGEPQRSSRPTTVRKTTTLLSSAVHSLDSLSITSPTRSTKRTVPEVTNSNEVRPHHKEQRTQEGNRVLNMARVPPTLHIPRKSTSESGSEPSFGSAATATTSSDDNSAPATPRRNPCDLGRIRRRRRV